MQPVRVQTGRPEGIIFLRKRLLQPVHILRIARILCCAVLFQNAKSQIAAQRRRYIQHIGKHTFVPVSVFLHRAVDQLLHDRAVYGKTLPHKAEAQNHIVFPVPDGHGIDLRRRKRSRHLMKTRKSLRVPGQLLCLHTAAVGLLDHRPILAHTRIVTGSRKKAGHGIQGFPQAVSLLIRQKRLGNQECASVQFFTSLLKMNPAIPHHRLKIPLQFLVSLIVATGHILGIVLHLSRNRRFVNTVCLPDTVKFIRCHIGRFRIYDSTVIQQFHTHGKKGNITFRSIFPFTAF